MKILVLGADGMLGNAIMRVLSESSIAQVYGSIRSFLMVDDFFSKKITQKLIFGIDVTRDSLVKKTLDKVKPDVLINCVGLIKHAKNGNDLESMILVNALLPHKLYKLCCARNIRLIHFSTDCVFSGIHGNYVENSLSDAVDVYGKSKFLGEISGQGAITLRTSVIGHEINTAKNLIEWFLAQQDKCIGYRKAIFSGLSTIELARVIRDYIIPRHTLSGIYHVAAQPISKYALLSLVANVYNKKINIVPDDVFVINRSLNSNYFNTMIGYVAPSWLELVQRMRSYYQ